MSKPAHKIRIGVLQVTIWRNHGEKGNWYSVIPTRSYKQGDDDLEGNRQPRLRRPADDGQAVRPGPHLDHAPAAGRRQGPRARNPSRQQPEPDAGGRLSRPPASFSTINFKESFMNTIENTTTQPQLIAVSRLEKSPLNARRTAAKVGMDELKASLLAHGLMQNLVVTDAGDGTLSRHRRRPPPGGDPLAPGRGQAAGGFRRAVPGRHRGARPGNEPCRKHRPAGHAPGRPV